MHWVGLMVQVSVVDEHQDHSVKLQRGRERKRLWDAAGDRLLTESQGSDITDLGRGVG